MTDIAQDWDPLAPEHMTDPTKGLDEVRERCPVAFSEQFGGFWSVLRHADVVAVARDTERFSSAPQFSVPKLDTGIPWVPQQADPPMHRHYRRIVNPYFFNSRLDSFKPVLADIANSLIDGFVERGEADLAREYNRQLPATALCLLLGVSTDHASMFDRWTRELVRCGAEYDMAGIMALYDEMIGFATEWMHQRRADPTDDVMSGMLAASIDGRPLTEDEIVGMFLTLVNAGHNTVTNTLGSAQLHLARFPELRQQLIDDPSLIPHAVEEFVRLFGAVQGLARTTNTDVEIGGRTIPAGSPVVLMFAAASRDGAVFDRPTECVLDRPSNPHVSFGAGIHKCVGEHLARIELIVGIRELLARIPHYEVSGDIAVAQWPTIGVYSLPVRFATA